MKRIGFLGAYSIDNAGDVLVGYATRRALFELLPDYEQLVFAPELPQPFWRHEWGRTRGIDAEVIPVPAGTSLDWAAGLSALIIGGGGIINLEPSFRPFLLGDPTHASDGAGPKAAWNAVCSQNQPWYLSGNQKDYAVVRACCEKLRYVSVRNRSTLKFLRQCGYSGDVRLVPDPALLLPVLLRSTAISGAIKEAASEEAEAALRECGVDPGKFVIGVSVGEAIRDARAAGFFGDLFAGLSRALSALACEVVFFPFGGIYGDDRLQKEAAARVPGARVLEKRLSPLGTFALIGRLRLHVCTRYHAMLAAFAQDVPFLVLDQYLSDATATSKIREFIAEHILEPFYLCPFLSTRPTWKLEGILQSLSQISYRADIADCQQRLWEHYRALVSALDLHESGESLA